VDADHDLYVLFDPGLGHPALAAGWEDTLRELLRICLSRQKARVLFTAHSLHDAERDAKVLKKILWETMQAGRHRSLPQEEVVRRKLYDLVRYDRNPWGSRLAAPETSDDGDSLALSKAEGTCVVRAARANHVEYLLDPETIFDELLR